MSDFVYHPAYMAQVARTPRVILAQFGDGYEQRTADGINAMPRKWSLSFQAVTATITAIDSFLATKAGVTAFTWTPSGESELLVVCRSWTRTRVNAGVERIDTAFEEVLA